MNSKDKLKTLRFQPAISTSSVFICARYEGEVRSTAARSSGTWALRERMFDARKRVVTIYKIVLLYRSPLFEYDTQILPSRIVPSIEPIEMFAIVVGDGIILH